MDQRIIQIGNSTGIILPKTLLNDLNWSEGISVVVEKDESGENLIITKKDSRKKKSTLSHRFLTILEKVNKQYGQALKELASK